MRRIVAYVVFVAQVWKKRRKNQKEHTRDTLHTTMSEQPPAKKIDLGRSSASRAGVRTEGGKRRKTSPTAASSSAAAAHVQHHAAHVDVEPVISESERFSLYVQRVHDLFPSDVPSVTTEPERTGERKQSRLNHSLARTRVPSTIAAVEAGRRWNAVKVPQDINDPGREYQAYRALNDDRVKMRLQLNKAASMGASAIAAMYRYSPFMLAEDLSLFSYDIKRERGIALNTAEFGGYKLYADTMMRFLCMYDNNNCGFYPYRLGRSDDMPADTYTVVCPFFQETKKGWCRAAQLLDPKPLVPDAQLQHPERQNKYVSPTTYEVQKTLELSAAKMCKAFRYLRNGIRYMVSYLNAQLRQPDFKYVVDFMQHWLTKNEQTIVACMIPIDVVKNEQLLRGETAEEITARSARYMQMLNTYVDHGEVEYNQPYYLSVSYAMRMSVGLLTYLSKNTPLPYFMQHVYEHIKRGFTAGTLTTSVPITHRIRWLSYNGTEALIDETTYHQPNQAMMAARKKLSGMVQREVMYYVEHVRDDPQRDSIVIEKKSVAVLRRYSNSLAYEPPRPQAEEAAAIAVGAGKRAQAGAEEIQQAPLKRINIEQQQQAAAAAEAEPRRRKTREETVVSSSSSSAMSTAAPVARIEPPKKKPQKEQREKPAASTPPPSLPPPPLFKPAAVAKPPPIKKKAVATPAVSTAAAVAPPLEKQIVPGSKRTAASSVDFSEEGLVPEVEGVEEQKSNVEKKKRKPLTEEEKQRIEQQRQRARMAAHQLMRQQMALQQQPLMQQPPPPLQYVQPQQQYLQPQPQYVQPPPPQQFGSLY